MGLRDYQFMLWYWNFTLIKSMALGGMNAV